MLLNEIYDIFCNLLLVQILLLAWNLLKLVLQTLKLLV